MHWKYSTKFSHKPYKLMKHWFFPTKHFTKPLFSSIHIQNYDRSCNILISYKIHIKKSIKRNILKKCIHFPITFRLWFEHKNYFKILKCLRLYLGAITNSGYAQKSHLYITIIINTRPASDVGYWLLSFRYSRHQLHVHQLHCRHVCLGVHEY